MNDDATAGRRVGADAAVPRGVAGPETLLPREQLSRLAELTTVELRSLRAACEEAEEGVSYARRLLQGRLDLLRAKLEQRGADADLLEALPQILAADEQSTDPLHARSTRVRVPPSADAHVALLDTVVSESSLARLDELEMDEIDVLVARAADHEASLSMVRRALFERIDAVRDELAARYKDGRADVGELLS